MACTRYSEGTHTGGAFGATGANASLSNRGSACLTVVVRLTGGKSMSLKPREKRDPVRHTNSQWDTFCTNGMQGGWQTPVSLAGVDVVVRVGMRMQYLHIKKTTFDQLFFVVVIVYVHKDGIRSTTMGMSLIE